MILLRSCQYGREIDLKVFKVAVGVPIYYSTNCVAVFAMNFDPETFEVVSHCIQIISEMEFSFFSNVKTNSTGVVQGWLRKKSCILVLFR